MAVRHRIPRAIDPRGRRLFRETLAEHLYTKCIGDTKCVYCGDIATGVDHIIPIAFVAANYDFFKDKQLILATCCRRCNSLLHDRVFKSFEEKRAWAQEKLKIHSNFQPYRPERTCEFCGMQAALEWINEVYEWRCGECVDFR